MTNYSDVEIDMETFNLIKDEVINSSKNPNVGHEIYNSYIEDGDSYECALGKALISSYAEMVIKDYIEKIDKK